MILEAIPGSLEGASQSAFAVALNWIRLLVLGRLALALAVMAIAGVGLGFLSGRIDAGRAVRVVVGCFILFGAPSIAGSLLHVNDGQRQVQTITPVLPPPARVVRNPQPFDPYAGASVPNQ